MLNATKAAAESLIIGTASAVNAAGKITQNASECADSARIVKTVNKSIFYFYEYPYSR
jgi:hypothetical protein